MTSASRTGSGANLQSISEALGIPVTESMERFSRAFAPQLRHFTELGVQIAPPAPILLTLGCGRAFGKQVRDFMVERGFEEELADRVPDLQEGIDEWMLVRFQDSPELPMELGVYFRRALSVEEARRWLAARGVNDSEQKALHTLGRLVDSDRTGIFAARFRPGEPAHYRVYLHLYEHGPRPVGTALVPVFEHFRIPGPQWQGFLRDLDALGEERPADVYVSLLLGDGDAFDSLKLDIFQVDLGSFERLVRDNGLLAPSEAAPVELGRTLGVDAAEHCGIRFGQESTGLTVYFVPPSP